MRRPILKRDAKPPAPPAAAADLALSGRLDRSIGGAVILRLTGQATRLVELAETCEAAACLAVRNNLEALAAWAFETFVPLCSLR